MEGSAAAGGAELAKAIARGERPAGWPADLPPATGQFVQSLARSCGERLIELEENRVRAEANLSDLRMMLAGYTRAKQKLREENELLKTAFHPARQPIIGADGALRDVLKLVDRVVDTPIPILLSGESGTGKEVIARYVHERSSRADAPLIAINCAALPEALLESELFGIEKGVATGVAERAGKIEQAEGGTLLLDEVCDMSLVVQAKILRAVQQREVVRLGGRAPIPVDVRFVSATNKDIQAEVAAGRFREDLYFRLVGLHVRLPPLRERREDLRKLLDWAFASTVRRFNRSVRGFAPDALAALLAYAWPGNVRELIVEVERAVAVAEGDLVALQDLTPAIATRSAAPGMRRAASAAADAAGPAPRGAADDEFESLRDARRRFELDHIQRAITRAGGSHARAAKLLGLTPEGLRRRLRALDVPARD
jgi:transcriptional regulator with PAS, ATPase and Fis domain